MTDDSRIEIEIYDVLYCFDVEFVI